MQVERFLIRLAGAKSGTVFHEFITEDMAEPQEREQAWEKQYQGDPLVIIEAWKSF